jgi:hypothetical protein
LWHSNATLRKKQKRAPRKEAQLQEAKQVFMPAEITPGYAFLGNTISVQLS